MASVFLLIKLIIVLSEFPFRILSICRIATLLLRPKFPVPLSCLHKRGSRCRCRLPTRFRYRCSRGILLQLLSTRIGYYRVEAASCNWKVPCGAGMPLSIWEPAASPAISALLSLSPMTKCVRLEGKLHCLFTAGSCRTHPCKTSQRP